MGIGCRGGEASCRPRREHIEGLIEECRQLRWMVRFRPPEPAPALTAGSEQEAVVPQMPAAVRRIALPMYTVVDGVNRWAYARRRGFATPIPPPNLRARTGARFIGRFIESGGSCAAALEA